VENEIDEIPQEQRNREEIEKIAKRVMSLNSKIRRYKDELEDWKQYTEEHTEATENRVRDIEDELD
jgi:DNA repair ATPase RecN